MGPVVFVPIVTSNLIGQIKQLVNFNRSLTLTIVYATGSSVQTAWSCLQDDANHDPQWSYEQCVAARLEAGGLLIGPDEIDIMSRTTVAVFEILEKSWASLDCSLIDMKIEFGVNATGKVFFCLERLGLISYCMW